jgi:hypothetical protein
LSLPQGGTPYIKVYGEARPERVYFSAKAGPGKGSIFLYILGKGMFFVKVVKERVCFCESDLEKVIFFCKGDLGKGYTVNLW